MRILLTINKTYRGQIDGGYYNFYLPFKALGHEVYFYDTVNPEEKNYSKIVESFKPDLIFCCMTGNKHITPHEPWEQIKKETTSGRTKTFNWFLDDTWRFDNFSSKTCHYFNVCSTSEPSYIQRFKNIGYNNIILGLHHLNFGVFPERKYEDKNIDASFIGSLTNGRKSFFNSINKKIKIKKIHGVAHKEMLDCHTRTKIGINLTINDNDPRKQTQLKLRIMEVTAGKGLLLTQYHKGIESLFEIDREIVTFNSINEFEKKFNFLIKRPKLIKKMSLLGHEKFLKEHESKVRVKKLLEQIQTI
jgi:spore maturation protein CgeB